MRRAVAAAATALLLAVPAAPAQERASLPDIEDEVMCVTCNVPLNIAESPQASRQRAFIRTQIERGLTKDEIKARLVDEYGEAVLAMPEDDGVGAAAYAVPIAVVAGMAALVVVLLPRWRRRTATAPAPPASAPAPAVSDAELRRLDEDLDRLA